MADFGIRRSRSAEDDQSATGDDDGFAERGPPSVPPGDRERDLAGALHEVSNALTVLMGWLARARDGGGPPEVERALEVAAGRASQARSIVRRAIGAEVEPEAGRSTGEVVRDAVLGLEPEAAQASVTVRFTLHEAAAGVVVPEPSRVVQILTNLLLNAIAVTPPGRVVDVDARVLGAVDGAGDRVVFGVHDEGPGVPPSRRATLLHAGLTTRKGGAGIGLRYATAMARAAGGELSLIDAEGGARFELSWPTGGALSRAIVDRAPTSMTRGRRPLEGKRILILEDDVAVVDLLDTALSARGAHVVSIHHRSDLEGALGTGPFDAALFDISPIQKDIRGALGTVREKSGGVRLVMISGSAETMPPLPEDWVAAWVRKPFEIAEILAALTPPRPAR